MIDNTFQEAPHICIAFPVMVTPGLRKSDMSSETFGKWVNKQLRENYSKIFSTEIRSEREIN